MNLNVMNPDQIDSAEATIDALTLRIKQILESSRSLSFGEHNSTPTTVSSVEKQYNNLNNELTPASVTSINTGFSAASAFGPEESESTPSSTVLKTEFLPTDLPLSPQTKPSSEPQETVKVEEKTSTEKTRCPYCDKECDTVGLRDHTDSCESRHIECEACGEKVMLDIFDFHLETCTASLYRQYNGDFLYNNPDNMHQINNEDQEQRNWPEGVEPEDEGIFDDGEDVEEDEGPMSVTDLTYEQLIALDNTIIKKGLTEEELQKCPVEVYLKELDPPVSCNVCLCDAESGEFVRKLSCGHKFHRECVDTWLKENITCPSCKTYLR